MSDPGHGELRVRFTGQQAKRLLIGLLIVNALLVTAYVGHVALRGVGAKVVYIIDMEAEANLPTWFATILLFTIGVVLLALAGATGRGQRPSALFLLIAGAGFVFLSADEASRIHEGATKALEGVRWLPRAKGGHMISVPVYAAIVLVLALLCCRDLWATWRHFRRPSAIIMLGVALLLLGAVGTEFVRFEFLPNDPKTALWHVQVVVEESLEMAGASVILYGVLLFAIARRAEGCERE